MSSRHARRISTRLPYLGKLTLSAGVITDVTRLAGVEGDGEAWPFGGVGVWPAAENKCTNGGFETNTTGWVGKAGGGNETLARVTTAAKFGSACAKITVSGSLGYEGLMSDQNLALVNGTVYTAGAWVWCETGTVNLRLRIVNSASVAIGTTNITATTTPQRVSVTVTATADTPFEIEVLVNGAQPGVVYHVDGVSCYASAIDLPYIETDGGTASRVLGRWQSPANPRLNGNQGWIAARFKCGGLGSYAPLIVLQNDTDSGSDNRVALDGDAAAGRYRVERRDAATTAVARLTVGDALVLGDDALVVARWSPTALGFAKGGGGAWVNTAATNVFNANNHHLDTRLRWSTTAGSYTTQYWVAAGDGVMPDDGRDLMHSWGNNDPLPHQFPRSWGLCELEHFNGDGTMYRYAA